MDKTLQVGNADGKYLLINVVARRAKALSRSGKATIPYAEGHFDPIDVAREEYDKEKLQICSRNDLTFEIEPFPDEE